MKAEGGTHVVFDLELNEAHSGAVRIDGPVFVWQLARDAEGLVTLCHKGIRALEVEVSLDWSAEWVLRCDRVDFPPGGIAYRHVHPGPGIRRILHGELTIDRGGEDVRTYTEGEAWFENADDPVVATASPSEDTAFVRVLLLPGEWAGRRTIRYLDPADDERPKLQRATVLLEVAL